MKLIDAKAKKHISFESKWKVRYKSSKTVGLKNVYIGSQNSTGSIKMLAFVFLPLVLRLIWFDFLLLSCGCSCYHLSFVKNGHWEELWPLSNHVTTGTPK